jgi:hypothetical protein
MEQQFCKTFWLTKYFPDLLAWDKCSFTGFTFGCASSTCDLINVLDDSTFHGDHSTSDGIIGPEQQLLVETGPGRTCYQLTQLLLALPALMHP